MIAIKRGIDVSEHQGLIHWEQVKPNIDFAILRAGYGQNNPDKYFVHNATECSNLGIPFGVYWFSYALNPDMAALEAEYCCDAISKYKIDYPVCFDYEYASYNYASKKGLAPSKNTLVNIAKSFLNRVEERGYYAMIYTNVDYLNKGFSELKNRFDIWLADWGLDKPSTKCGMWQQTSKGGVPGISSYVDIDYAYYDYPKIIGKARKNNAIHILNKTIEVINGNYGTNDNSIYNKLLIDKEDADLIMKIRDMVV